MDQSGHYIFILPSVFCVFSPKYCVILKTARSISSMKTCCGIQPWLQFHYKSCEQPADEWMLLLDLHPARGGPGPKEEGPLPAMETSKLDPSFLFANHFLLCSSVLLCSLFSLAHSPVFFFTMFFNQYHYQKSECDYLCGGQTVIHIKISQMCDPKRGWRSACLCYKHCT